MRRGAPVELLALVGASTAFSIGLAVWLRRPDNAPSSPAPPPTPGPPGDGQATADLDRAVVATLDQTLPGTLRSYDLIRQSVIKDPEAVQASSVAYKSAFDLWLQERVTAGQIRQQYAQDAKDILNSFQAGARAVEVASPVVTAAGSAAGIPGLGAVIQGVWKIATLFEQIFVDAAKEGRSPWRGQVSSGEPIFTGFRDGVFWCWDTPVWSFTAPMWISVFVTAAGGPGGFDAVFKAFDRLATAYPFGYAVSPVTIQSDGTYTYRFSLSGTLGGPSVDGAPPGDSTRQVDVYNPADITASGPRGYDPADPLGWKVPGQKLAKRDVPAVVRQRGGNL